MRIRQRLGLETRQRQPDEREIRHTWIKLDVAEPQLPIVVITHRVPSNRNRYAGIVRQFLEGKLGFLGHCVQEMVWQRDRLRGKSRSAPDWINTPLRYIRLQKIRNSKG